MLFSFPLGETYSRIEMQESAVGFEVDDCTLFHKLAVQVEEIRRSKTLVLLLGLRVGEGNPNLRHFPRTEEIVYHINPRAQESGVCDVVLQRLFCTFPDTRTLDVNAYKIALRVRLTECNSVFALAATEFEGDGIIIVEKIIAPLALVLKILHHQFGGLHHIGEVRHLCKFF